MPGFPAYIIAARRSANGRLGGLHRNRRLEDLAAPVLAQTLADAGIEPARVDSLLLGNTTAGSNPARLVGLIGGLPDRATAMTLDRHAASGLEAILLAVRLITEGDAQIVAAGGAEALSTAPWRLAKPRSLAQLPRVIPVAQADGGEGHEFGTVELTEALASRLDIARNRQDEYAIADHIRATLARNRPWVADEIVALHSRAGEGRDELVDEPDIDDMQSFPTFLEGGTLTTGNVSLPADGAAFVLVVSEAVHQSLGRPPALALAQRVSIGVASVLDVEAPTVAAHALARKLPAGRLSNAGSIELGESSAAQAIAFREAFDLPDGTLNPEGGQIARGQPIGAAGAVLAVRLFSRLVRAGGAPPTGTGATIIGAAGGQALAALFRRV